MKFLPLIFLLLHMSLPAKEVSMVTVDWPPYYGEDLLNQGVVAEIVTEAFAGSEFEPSLNFLPWPRAMRAVELGAADVLMGAYYTKKRAERFYYSDPILPVKVVLIAHKDANITSFNNLRELSGYRIGIGRGWANSPEFDAANYLQKERATNQTLNLRKLFYKRVDMVVMSQEVFHYEMLKHPHYPAGNFVQLQPLLGKNPLHLIVSKNHPNHGEILQQFNQGLAKLRASGRYEQILLKHGFTPDPD